MLTFHGCGQDDSLNVCNTSDSFDGKISVNVAGKSYKCELLHTPEKVSIVKVLEPPNLSGLTFSWENDKYSVSWKDLSCEFNKQFMPDTSFLSDVIYVMNSLHQKELLKNLPDDSEDKIYTGSCEAGEFKVVFDKNGYLKQIDINDKDIHIKTECNI